MWFAGWESLGRTLLSCAVGYVALVALLRIAGKRTVSKMNAFDLVVTVAIGSVLATLVTSQMAIADGVAALALLIALQFAVAWTSSRAAWFGRLVKAQPAAVLREGALDGAAMRRERIAADEVRAALREAGVADLDDAALVVLETDGTLTVLRRSQARAHGSATQGVRGL
ncbi:MAG: DUF421 domain-containing protein [Proteobacteria bacterium]|nr:MAG: DUF421 domain-containing protein [Pseudomonadota bacterium]